MFYTLSAKMFRIILLTVLLGISAACDVGATEVPTEVTSRLMYFVPAEWEELESGLSPQDLIELDVMEMGYTSSWDTIVTLGQAGDLDALIIHHTAFDAVDQEILAEWFQDEALVLMGIGIPGLELASAVQMPSMFFSAWSEDFDDTIHNYYFIYSYRETPGGGSRRSTSEMITNEDQTRIMLHVLREHLENW